MQTIKSPIYQTQQIREFERLASERFNLTGQVLMQRAGKAAFDFLLKRWPQTKKIAVFCGAGNNGGDGYVLAKEAAERGMFVAIWQVGAIDNMKEDAKIAYEACQQTKIEINVFNESANLQHPDVIVDAICGIGVHDQLREEVVSAIKKMQKSQLPIFSLDIPTGIDADTGCILGAAVQATATMTFIGNKLGLLTGAGVSYTGELISNDLQLPTELFSYIEPVAEKIHVSAYVDYLKPRSKDWHKGLSGHVLVIGGELGFSGAPRMAAEAALRIGAGLVSIATRPDNVWMNVTCPEIMCHGINTVDDLAPLVAKADVIVLGPGLGQSDWSKAIWEYVCQQSLPLVMDADALNLLSQKKADHFHDNWVLTPHPGEAARLLDETPKAIQADRLAAVKEMQKKFGGVAVLKGAGTLVVSPNSLPALCDKGNPGMATAGMGDILSGVIGGLIAQEVPLGEAAKLGVSLHAKAGDLAAKDGERGMIATDLMPYLRRLSNLTSTST